MRLFAALLVVSLAGCGITTPCSEAGETFSGKQLGVHCCPGLAYASEDLVPCEGDCESTDGLPDGCQDYGPPDGVICLACGDAVCGVGENYCNCPDDCAQN